MDMAYMLKLEAVIPSGCQSRQAVGERMEKIMGRGILLWLLGVPIPVIIILALLFH